MARPYGWGRRGFGGGFIQMPEPIPPPPPSTVRVAIATLDGNGLNAIVSPRFARAPYIVIVDILGGNVVNHYVVPNPAASAPRGAGVAVARWLISSQVNVVLAVNLGLNIQEILSQANIRVEYTQPGIKVIDALRLAKLVGM